MVPRGLVLLVDGLCVLHHHNVEINFADLGNSVDQNGEALELSLPGAWRSHNDESQITTFLRSKLAQDDIDTCVLIVADLCSSYLG